jgi:uncharacterized membrane protein YeaQ/YmgE (transglycosylase-associated protein family)
LKHGQRSRVSRSQASRAICHPDRQYQELKVDILWIIVIGFIAGVIARHLAPGPDHPHGFVFTLLLGIAGAFVARQPTLRSIGRERWQPSIGSCITQNP